MRKRRRNPPVVVYCYHANSSRDLCTLLSGFGFSQVFNLEGGWRAWDNFQARQQVQLSEAEVIARVKRLHPTPSWM